jgi:hypothetical protein
MTSSAAGAVAQPAADFVTLNWQGPQYDLSTQNYPADIYLRHSNKTKFVIPSAAEESIQIAQQSGASF